MAIADASAEEVGSGAAVGLIVHEDAWRFSRSTEEVAAFGNDVGVGAAFSGACSTAWDSRAVSGFSTESESESHGAQLTVGMRRFINKAVADDG